MPAGFNKLNLPKIASKLDSPSSTSSTSFFQYRREPFAGRRVGIRPATDALSIGHGAIASGMWATAAGIRARADAEGTSVGSYAEALDKMTVAVGHNARATYPLSMAIGGRAIANKARAIAIGHNAAALHPRSIMIGDLLRSSAEGEANIGGLRYYSVRQFGAVGDGTADDTSAIQAAIDAAIANTGVVYLPIGRYKITSPLLGFNWDGADFTWANFSMIGEKLGWRDDSGTAILTARIEPSFNDEFALGIQNGRAVLIKDITFEGNNDVESQLTPTDYPEMMTNSNFLPGSARDNRYSPHCGICIDPFGTSSPGASNEWPNLSNSYYDSSAAGSSRIRLEGVLCKNFVVGTLITAHNTSNAEDIEFIDCHMMYNKSGVAVSQSQSRNVNWRGGAIFFNLYGFDGVTYGDQQGVCPNIYGVNMNGKFLFNVYSSFGQPTVNATGIFAESFASIGYLGSAAVVTHPAVFNGCQFSFNDLGGTFPDFHAYSNCPIYFNGCDFDTSALSPYVTPLRFWHRHQYGQIVFNGCTFGPHIQEELPMFFTAGSNTLQNTSIQMNGCQFRGDSSSRGGQVSEMSNIVRQDAVGSVDEYTVLGGSMYQFSTGGEAGNLYMAMPYEHSVSLGSKTVTTGSNGTATFTATDASIIRTGDIIVSNTSKSYEDNAGGTTISTNWMALGIVTSIVSTTITIAGWPQSIATGTYDLYGTWWPRFHQATTGDTNTSTSITNVDQPGAWSVGQKIRGTDIVEGTYITNISGSTFTISKAATGTTVGVRLYDADLYVFSGTAV